MAGLVTITTFSGLAPPWSLTQLDTDLTNLRDAIQNQNTFSNYLVDTGVANAYVVTPAAGLTGTLTAGLMVQFKASASNTGASTLNYNALGAKNITNADGTALASGQIQAGGVVQVVYDGTQFMLSASTPAGIFAWTPTLKFGGASVGITFSTVTGRGTLLANRLFYNIVMILTSKGSSVGTAVIGGLPVAVNANGQPAASVVAAAFSAGTNVVQAQPLSTSTNISLTNFAAGAATALTDTNFANNSTLYLTGHYEI